MASEPIDPKMILHRLRDALEKAEAFVRRMPTENPVSSFSKMAASSSPIPCIYRITRPMPPAAGDIGPPAPKSTRPCCNITKTASPDPHSFRSATAGSIRDARHAGAYPAATAAVINIPIAAANASGSFAFTPYRNDSTSFVV